MTEQYQANRQRRVGRLLSFLASALLGAFSVSAQDLPPVRRLRSAYGISKLPLIRRAALPSEG